MKETVWYSVEDLHNHAKKTTDKQIKDLVQESTTDKYYANPKNKGWIGNSIESDWFGLANNSRQEADFLDLGVELKVTPIIMTKKGWSAKERLTLNIFDFYDEYKRNFKEASFLKKASLIELIYYEFVKDTPSPEYYIKAATLLDLNKLPKEDMLIIEQDWNIIVNKIKEGKAEELSDSLTKYLGATTKGSKSERNMTTQPFSDKKAHRRAFTLKGSYMTFLARQIMSGEYGNHTENIIKNVDELNEKSFEDIILDQFKPFIGWNKRELGKKFNVNIPEKNDKASSALLARKMLNIQGEIQNTEEFKKAGIAVQIVTLDTKKMATTEGIKINIPGEDYIKPTDLVKENWNSSILNSYLSSYQYLFVVFERTKEGDVFRGAKFWYLPQQKLDSDVKDVWLDTKRKFTEGLNLRVIPFKEPTSTGRTYKVKNELIGVKKRQAIYVNTSSRYASYVKSKDATKVSVKNNWIDIPSDISKNEFGEYYFSKHAWWLNPYYIFNQVQELL